ncbi:MAG TPA: TIGR03619 family F420-dependent LLM class oxidoreductase [Candidatus Limnocylindrales bacterium]|nr:TIGR03619 family F420-dependent LLM class oxidoreductase [Candidatus Limnocylindrales bacterium]
MDYGIVLPSIGDDASREGILAACEAAERHGFGNVWGTDHLLVDRGAAEDYGRTYEMVALLAWVAGRFSKVRVGASVFVVPYRNAVILAKELATLDDLSGGRVIAGFGAGWNEAEFANLGIPGRYHERGAYLEETVALCRHLWSGSSEPFHGAFHSFDDFVFGPPPAQGASLPIWLGGRHVRAIRRAGRLADAYHASASAPASIGTRVPAIRAAAEAAGRPMPRLSGRVRVALGQPAESYYTMHGSPEAVAAEIRSFADVGVSHLALAFPSREPEALDREIDRFVAEVLPLV